MSHISKRIERLIKDEILPDLDFSFLTLVLSKFVHKTPYEL